MACYPYGKGRNLPVIVWIRGTKVNSYYTASILGGDEFCVILTRNVDRIDPLNAAFACRLQNNRAQLYRVKNEKKAAARS